MSNWRQTVKERCTIFVLRFATFLVIINDDSSFENTLWRKVTVKKGQRSQEVWWSSFENTLWRKIIIRKNIVKKIHKLKTHCEEKSQWRKAKEVWWSSRNSIKGFRYSQTSILAQDRKQLETRQGDILFNIMMITFEMDS